MFEEGSYSFSERWLHPNDGQFAYSMRLFGERLPESNFIL